MGTDSSRRLSLDHPIPCSSHWFAITPLDRKKLRNIGARLGHVHVDTIELVEGRMLVDIDSRRPLKFSRKVESKDGDEITIEIKYELLF